MLFTNVIIWQFCLHSEKFNFYISESFFLSLATKSNVWRYFIKINSTETDHKVNFKPKNINIKKPDTLSRELSSPHHKKISNN